MRAFAFAAGSCIMAATASVCAKMAAQKGLHVDAELACYAISFILANVIMWLLLGHALAASRTAIIPYSINTCTNILVSGMAGRALFGEALSPRWLLGTALMGAGMVVLHAEQARGQQAPQPQGTPPGTPQGASKGNAAGTRAARKTKAS